MLTRTLLCCTVQGIQSPAEGKKCVRLRLSGPISMEKSVGTGAKLCKPGLYVLTKIGQTENIYCTGGGGGEDNN